MGNSLCKERHDRYGNHNRPVQRVLGSCPQVFSIGNKEHEKWPNHVLETRPPATGEWKNVTLRPVVPTTAEPTSKSITLPIVPPRRKKTEKLLKLGRPGGFKEVFGNGTRRSSCDSVSSVVLSPPKRRNSSSDLTKDSSQTIEAGGIPKKPMLVRKISKVGNRKSDQFFGENLSDLSDEPVAVLSSTPIKSEMLDEIDAFINATATEQEAIKLPVEKKSQGSENIVKNESISKQEPVEIEMPSLNKKAEFLMAMLDEYNSDVIQYRNQSPVEEPIIVPKRKHGRHICDDHDRLKRAVAPSEVSFDIIDNKSPIDKQPDKAKTLPHNASEIVSPQKPQRDFARYRDSIEMENKSVPSLPIDIASTVPVKTTPPAKNTSVLRESLPMPPPRPTRIETKEVPQENDQKPAIVAQISSSETQLNTDHINTSLYNDKMDAVLKKCNSSHSFLTPDLMDQIVNKVYGFKMNWDDHDNVHSGYDDYSGQVAPNSKLKTRKISVIRKDQIIEKPIVEEPAVEPERTEASPTHKRHVSLNEMSTSKPKFEVEEPKHSNFSIGNVSIKVTPNIPATSSDLNDANKLSTSLDKPNGAVPEKDSKVLTTSVEHAPIIIPDVADVNIKSVSGSKSRELQTQQSNQKASVLSDLKSFELPSEQSKPQTASVHTTPTALVIADNKTVEIPSDLKSVESPSEQTAPIATESKPIESPTEHNTPLASVVTDTKTVELQSEQSKPSALVVPDSKPIDATLVKQPEIPSDSKPVDAPLVKEPVSSTESSTLKKSDTVIEITKMLKSETKLEDAKPVDSNVLEDIYTQNRSVLSTFHSQFDEPNHLVDQREINDEQKKTNPFLDSEETFVQFTDRRASFVDPEESGLAFTDRRGSIVDHDEWFNEHRDISADDQPIRRGSETSLTYDTNSLFPFGKREKLFSESSDFFEASLTCSRDIPSTLPDSVVDSDSNDHSTLLKYLPAATK